MYGGVAFSVNLNHVFDLRKFPSLDKKSIVLHSLQPSGAKGSRSWLGLFPKPWLVVRVFRRCLAQGPCSLADFHGEIHVSCGLSGSEFHHIQCLMIDDRWTNHDKHVLPLPTRLTFHDVCRFPISRKIASLDES